MNIFVPVCSEDNLKTFTYINLMKCIVTEGVYVYITNFSVNLKQHNGTGVIHKFLRSFVEASHILQLLDNLGL